MAVPVGPQQNAAAAKKRSATGPANSSDKPVHQPAAADRGVAQKKRPVLAQDQEADATDCNATEKLPELAHAAGATPAATHRDSKKQPEAVPAAVVAVRSLPTDSDAKKSQGVAAAPSCYSSGNEGAKNFGAPNAAAAASDSGGLGPKKQFQATATAVATTTSGNRKGEEGPEEDPATTCIPGDKKSPESVLTTAAAPFSNNSSAPDGGRPKESRDEDAKNCGASEPAAVASDSGVLERKKRLQATTVATITISGEKRGEEGPAAACSPSEREWTKSGLKGGGKMFSRPWMQQQRSQEGTDFICNNSFLNRLFECCGLTEIIIGNDLKVPRVHDLKVPHVHEQRNVISEAKSHYKIEESVVKKLSEAYSSFRVVLGDGECFYRSFIFSYMEIVVDNDDTSEEESRILSSIEKISLACLDVEWLYDEFCTHCKAFKELLQKVKSWKTQTRAVRRMLLLTYFGDYKETESIFSFLRISCAAWILTQPEFSAFYVIENGITLVEYCRSQILQRRSYADNVAIAALADALGIPTESFAFKGVIYKTRASHQQSRALQSQELP